MIANWQPLPWLSKAILFLVIVISTASTTLFAVNGGMEPPLQGACLFLLLAFFFMNLALVVNSFTWKITLSYSLIFLYFVLLFGNELIFHKESSAGLIFIYAIGAFLTCVVLPQVLLGRRGMLVYFLWAVVSVGAVIGATGILGSLGFDSLFGLPIFNKYGYAKYASFPASSGILDYPETLGAQMAFSLICAMYLFSRTKPTLLLMICTVLIAGGLISSQGRAAILGAAVGIGGVLLGRITRMPSPLLAVLAVLLVLSPIYALDVISMLPGAESYLRAQSGLSGREGVWSFALNYISENPWRGYGFQSSNAYTLMHDDFLRRHGFPVAGASFHNTFLNRAFENGVVVSAIYATALFAALIRASSLLIRKSPEAALTFAALVLVVSISTFRDVNIGGMRQIVIFSAVFIGLALQLNAGTSRRFVKTSSNSRRKTDTQLPRQQSSE